MGAIQIPLFDHEDLKEIIDNAIEDLKEKFVPRYVIEDAITKIKAAPIPEEFALENERAAYAEGAWAAIVILQKCVKEEAADDKETEKD